MPISHQTEPPWLTEARKHVGQREIKGPKHSQFILNLWKLIRRGGIKDDETPWCAAFVGGCLEQAGVESSRFESAASYQAWGRKLDMPALGAIAVFRRLGGMHVAFIVGLTNRNEVVCLGGNQSDAVNLRAFPMSRLVSVRWPTDRPIEHTWYLLNEFSKAELSSDEA